MPDAATHSTSPALTVHSAATVLESLLSHDEDTSAPDATPDAPVADEAHEDVEPEEFAEETGDDEGEIDEGEEDVAPEPPQPKTRKLKIEGAEVEVTDEELEKGYLRTADYTRKTQQLAEARKAHEAEQHAVRAEREQYAAALAQLKGALDNAAPAEPDWDTLRSTMDPADFAAAVADWQLFERRKQAVSAEQHRVAEQVMQDRMQQMQAALAAEHGKLLEAIPSWKDAKIAKQEKADLVDFAKRHGYTDEELAQVYDHRVLVLLRKGMMHDRAAAQKPSVQQRIERVKVAAPGPATQQRNPVSELTRQKQRLAKTGRVEDAARAIELSGILD